LKRLKFIIYTRPFIWLAYYIIRIYSATFRLAVVNEAPWKALLLKEERPVILCTWHQQFFAAIRHFKTYASMNPGLMISRSRDGDLIAGVANRTGWHTPRGSSSRGGRQAMAAMLDHLQTHKFGAHILDGPQGPMGIVKAGIVKMAMETGAVVVPFYVRSDNAWFFNSWDRFMLPKPFSRVTLEYNDPIDLDILFDSPEDPDRFESMRAGLEKKMGPGLYH